MSTQALEQERSLAERFALAPDEVRERFLVGLSEEEAEELKWDWGFWSRPKQRLPEGDWLGWLVMTGRGWGKNKTASETLRQEVREGRTRLSGIIGRTAADVRDVMVEGESGILNVCPDWERPRWEPSRRRLVWPSGAVTKTYSAEEPDLLRGPQHDLVWGDEVAAWKFGESWDNAMLGLRLRVGAQQPRWLITTTPKPRPLVRKLLREVEEGKVVLTTGSTYENRSNLAPVFMRQIVSALAGTRLESQEIHGRLMEADPNALWNPELLEANRVTSAPHLRLAVVAVDPQSEFRGDDDAGTETGIVAGGLGDDGKVYVVDDASLRGKPEKWANEVVAAYGKLKGDYVVAEVNNGGDMVVSTIQGVDRMILVKKITASRGKRTRAEPVAVLYDQGMVKHVGYFAELESQMCTWVPGEASPDRMDALVWLVTELAYGSGTKIYGRDYAIT